MLKPTLNSILANFAKTLLACISLLPATAHAWQGGRDVKHEVERLEQQWRTAQLAGDVATLDRMLSDDYVGVTMAGQVNTKVQQLARVRNHVFVVTRLDLQEMKVKVAGEVAIVTVKARVEGTNEQRKVNGICRYTRIYHHLPTGGWKITNFEATRLPSSIGRMLPEQMSLNRVDHQS